MCVTLFTATLPSGSTGYKGNTIAGSVLTACILYGGTDTNSLTGTWTLTAATAITGGYITSWTKTDAAEPAGGGG